MLFGGKNWWGSWGLLVRVSWELNGFVGSGIRRGTRYGSGYVEEGVWQVECFRV